MIKRTISIFLLLVLVFSIFIENRANAQTIDDYVNSIPIVEYIPVRDGDNNSYNDAKIISVSREVADSSGAEQLVSLVREDNVVFFTGMTVDEASRATGLDSYDSQIPDDELIVGTSITKFQGTYHFIESVVTLGEPLNEECEECGHVDTNTDRGRLSVLPEDYDEAARYAYANAKIFELSEPKGFPSGAGLILTKEDAIKNFGVCVGRVSYAVYIYSRGSAVINGVSRKVYDCIASCYVSPKGNAKTYRIQPKLGYVKDDYAILESTRIASKGQTTSVSCSLGIGATGLSGVAGASWSYTSDAYNCVNSFSDPKVRSWSLKPVSAMAGDAWDMCPGIRIYTKKSGVVKGQIYIELTGTLNNCFIFHAKKTIKQTTSNIAL